MRERTRNMTIREFRIRDYQSVLQLWKTVKLPLKPRGRDRLTRIKFEITRPNSIFLVAETETGIIGTILGTHDGRKGWINRLAVHPDFQHRGIASMMVRNVEKKLETMGIDIVACLIEDDNQSSMAFFEKIGYRKHPDIFYFSKRKYRHT